MQNIERGYQLDRIIAHLQRLSADILLLQEVDNGCLRSGRVDIAAEIARALALNYVCYSSEEPVWRKGVLGVCGNAIISRWPFLETWFVCSQPQ